MDAKIMALSPLAEADLDIVLAWRNAPAVRKAMYSHHEITPAEHRLWFKRIQDDPSVAWFVFRDLAEMAQGVVYFTALDLDQRTGFWGFYARPEAPRGTGLRMELAALEFAFGDLKLHKLSCEVLASNPAVINMHMKAGFSQEGVFREQHFNGREYVDITRLGMLETEWPQYREQLQLRVDALTSSDALRHPTD